MTLHDAVKLIGAITVKGPTPLMYANVHLAFTILARADLSRVEMVEIIGEGHYESHAYNLLHHIFLQPYGYAGDFALLAKYYDAYDQGYTEHIGSMGTASRPNLNASAARMLGLGHTSNWDKYVLSMPVAQSVFNREKYLLDKISGYIDSGQVESVLDVACGDGRLIRKLQSRYPHVMFHGIDAEIAAIRLATELKSESAHPTFKCMNAMRELPRKSFDLVVSAGLFDYLKDDVAMRLLRRFRRYNTPKYMIIGNMAEHGNMAEMKVMGWPLIYRTGADMVSMAGAGDCVLKQCYIEYEDLNINMFLNTEETN